MNLWKSCVLLVAALTLGLFTHAEHLIERGAATTQSEPQRTVVYPGGEGPGAGKHIVLISGDEEYRSEEALPMLGKILSVRHGFKCTVLFSQKRETAEIDPDESNYIPGLEALGSADMMVLFTRFRRLPDEDMKHIVDYVESGKPLLGIRTATHAFNYEKDSKSAYASWTWNGSAPSGGFGRQVLGETWISHHGHHGSESTRGVIPSSSSAHPILRGVTDVWGLTDVYGIKQLPADATVLLEGSILEGMSPSSKAVEGERNAPRHPVTWTRERALDGGVKQRVIGSTIGAAIDLESEHLRRLFINACYWGLGMDDSIPAWNDARLVGDYEPTMFGFGSFVKGVFPADHNLTE